MKKGFYYILLLLITSLLWSCSTKKNTKASRFYHAFTSRYNIYFNGKTSFDEAFLSMQNGYKESYSDMILMYPISAQPLKRVTKQSNSIQSRLSHLRNRVGKMTQNNVLGRSRRNITRF